MADLGNVNPGDQVVRPRVAVIGGGLAGITSAIKLYRQGYRVTLFEAASGLGGNLSSNSADSGDATADSASRKSGDRDIYPHIFGDWYQEFWCLLEGDLGFERAKYFVKNDQISIGVLSENSANSFEDVQYANISMPTTIEDILNNLECGIFDPLDMFIFGSTYLDLAGMPVTPKTDLVLSQLDVAGFLATRPYTNNDIARFHDDILKVIWSMPANQTSAQAYRNLLRHTMTFPKKAPFSWFLNGPASPSLMSDIESRLKSSLQSNGGGLCLNTKVTGIELPPKYGVDPKPGAPVKLHTDAGNDPKEFDYVVLATPARQAREIAFSPWGENCLASRYDCLARLCEAVTGRIPVVYLFFTETALNKKDYKWEALPKNITGFEQFGPGPSDISNDYDITILNLSRIWSHEFTDILPDQPALVVAASHSTAINAPDVGDGGAPDPDVEAFQILKKLKQYYPFLQIGEHWGDVNSDVDYNRTRYISNEQYQLFLNDTSSDEWRPLANICANDRVFFAGDYCMTDVDMAPVEAAVQSGVLAARALQAKAGFGNAIPLQAHTIYGDRALLFAKLALTPATYVASAIATCCDATTDLRQIVGLPYGLMVMSAYFGADWLRSASQFLGTFLPPAVPTSNSGSPVYDAVADHDDRIGLIDAVIGTGIAFKREARAILPRLPRLYWVGLKSVWTRAAQNLGGQQSRAGRAPKTTSGQRGGATQSPVGDGKLSIESDSKPSTTGTLSPNNSPAIASGGQHPENATQQHGKFRQSACENSLGSPAQRKKAAWV